MSISLTHNDVALDDLGGGHMGNYHWRALVNSNKSNYLSLPTPQKALVAESIVHFVRSQNPPGRFLQKGGDGMWYDVGDRLACEVTLRALRGEGGETTTTMRGDSESDFTRGRVLTSGQTDSHSQAASSANTLKATKGAAAMPYGYDAKRSDESTLQTLQQQIQAGTSIPLQHSQAPSSALVPNFLSSQNLPLSFQAQPTAGFEGFRHQLALEIAMAEKMMTSRQNVALVDPRMQEKRRIQNAELAAFQQQYSLVNGGAPVLGGHGDLEHRQQNLLGGQNFPRRTPNSDQATNLLEEQQIDSALKELEKAVLQQQKAIPQQHQLDYSLHRSSQLSGFDGSQKQDDIRLPSMPSMPGAVGRPNASLNQDNFLRELGLPSHNALLGLGQEALTRVGDLSLLSHQDFLNFCADRGVERGEIRDHSGLISLSSGPRSNLSRDAQLAQMNRIWNQQRMALARVADDVVNESRESGEQLSSSDDSLASERQTRQTSLDTLARAAEMVSFNSNKSSSSLSDENMTIRNSSNLSTKKKEKKISSIWQKMKQASRIASASNLKLGKATQSLVDTAPIKRKKNPVSGEFTIGNAKKGPTITKKIESKNGTNPKQERAIEPHNDINEQKAPKKRKLNISKGHPEAAINAPAEFAARSGSHESLSTISHELLPSAKNIAVEPPLAEVSYRGHNLPEADEGQFDDPEDE